VRVSRRWMLAVVPTVLVCCGVQPQDHPQPIAGASTHSRPSGSAGSIAQADEALSGGVVYLIRGSRLAAVKRTAHTLYDQLARLLDGPTPAEHARGLRSALPAGGEPARVHHDGAVTIVDVPDEFFQADGIEQVLGVAHLMYTFTDNTGRHTAVRLRRDGNDLPAPTSTGELVNRPVTRADYASLAPR
jgi:Sporulation and spore germination